MTNKDKDRLEFKERTEQTEKLLKTVTANILIYKAEIQKNYLGL